MSLPPEVPRSNSKGYSLDNANVVVQVKPRRPYTPYNLFYLLERELVVQEKEPAMAEEKRMKRASMLADPKRQNLPERSEEDIPLPTRYKHCILLPHWYEPNLKEKRKHRKTHGKVRYDILSTYHNNSTSSTLKTKSHRAPFISFCVHLMNQISFKDLTEIISRNWAAIDKETKDYCTHVSEIGRKRYKETMIRYNASQKIIQLKEEQAAMAMEHASRMKRTHAQQQQSQLPNTKICRSPMTLGRGKKNSNPVTPERILSHHAPIVTPSRSAGGGYNNHHSQMNMNMRLNAGPHAAFYQQYGPPPPLPPPMPSSMSAHRGGHTHPGAMPGQQQQIPRSMMQMYRQHQQQQHHHQPLPPLPQKFNYPKPPPMSKLQHKQAMKMASKAMQYEQQQAKMSSPLFTNLPTPTITNTKSGKQTNVNVSINVCVTKDDSSNDGSHKTGMSHEEAVRLCSLMESPGRQQQQSSSQYETPLNDTLLKDMGSFDFADQHSLSSESGDMSHQLDVANLLDHDNDDKFMNLILGGGDDDAAFPDIRFGSCHTLGGMY